MDLPFTKNATKVLEAAHAVSLTAVALQPRRLFDFTPALSFIGKLEVSTGNVEGSHDLLGHHHCINIHILVGKGAQNVDIDDNLCNHGRVHLLPVTSQASCTEPCLAGGKRLTDIYDTSLDGLRCSSRSRGRTKGSWHVIATLSVICHGEPLPPLRVH